jgi:hypothetical protein
MLRVAGQPVVVPSLAWSKPKWTYAWVELMSSSQW